MKSTEAFNHILDLTQDANTSPRCFLAIKYPTQDCLEKISKEFNLKILNSSLNDLFFIEIPNLESKEDTLALLAINIYLHEKFPRMKTFMGINYPTLQHHLESNYTGCWSNPENQIKMWYKDIHPCTISPAVQIDLKLAGFTFVSSDKNVQFGTFDLNRFKKQLLKSNTTTQQGRKAS